MLRPARRRPLLLLLALVPLLLLAVLLALYALPGVLGSHARMLRALREIKKHGFADHAYLGNRALFAARRELAELPADARQVTRISCHVLVGYHELRAGELDRAFQHLQAAEELMERTDERIPAGMRRDVHVKLAMAWMRKGELQNCIAGHTRESCLFPIRGSGVHQDPTGSLKAIPYLEKMLADDPGDLEARWLLNLAHMTVGQYPEQVPSDYLIPPESFGGVQEGAESENSIPRFRDVAADVGLATWSLAGASVVEDFDNDGLLDVIVSDWSPSGQLRYFHREPDGTFQEWTERAGLLGVYGGLNAVQADYNNDGYVDLLILRGAWLNEGGRYPNSLLRNDGGRRFTDVTFSVGLGEVHYPTQAAGWADFDNDGDLDLYVGNERFPSQLFENDGRGGFRDIAERAGVTNDRMAKAVSWGDYDGDDLPDLYVANLASGNRLYRNNGNGTFADVAVRLRVSRPARAFPSWFWDYNNDGVLDLYSASYVIGLEHVAADALGETPESETDRLYEGDGQGGFRDVTEERGLSGATQPMGANFGDLDNDGYLDFYLGTGYPEYEALMPNLLLHNQGGRGFVNVTAAAGVGHLQKGHGIAFADLDNDGDQDIFAEMGGWYPGDAFANVLFENPGNNHHWFTIRLVGRESNRSAIGARLKLVVKDDGATAAEQAGRSTGSSRVIYRWVNSGGSFGAGPLRREIGLGSARRIESLEVYWPTTGRTQAFGKVAVDQFVELVEGQDRLRPLVAPQVPFPAGSGGDVDHGHHHHAASAR